MIVRPLSCSACTRDSPRRRNSRSRRLVRPCSYSTCAALGGPQEAKSRPNAQDTHECTGKGFQLPTQPHQKFIQRCQPAAIHHTVRAKLPSRATQRLNQGRTSRIQESVHRAAAVSTLRLGPSGYGGLNARRPTASSAERKNLGRHARRNHGDFAGLPLAVQRAVLPNPSLKRSANGMSRWPSSAGPAAHFALAVQRAMPSSPA